MIQDIHKKINGSTPYFQVMLSLMYTQDILHPYLVSPHSHPEHETIFYSLFKRCINSENTTNSETLQNCLFSP